MKRSPYCATSRVTWRWHDPNCRLYRSASTDGSAHRPLAAHSRVTTRRRPPLTAPSIVRSLPTVKSPPVATHHRSPAAPNLLHLHNVAGVSRRCHRQIETLTSTPFPLPLPLLIRHQARRQCSRCHPPRSGLHHRVGLLLFRLGHTPPLTKKEGTRTPPPPHKEEGSFKWPRPRSIAR
jgi:hypothetical protein